MEAFLDLTTTTTAAPLSAISEINDGGTFFDFTNVNTSTFDDYEYQERDYAYNDYVSDVSFEDTLILPEKDEIPLTIRMLDSVRNHSLYNLTLLPEIKPKIWDSREAFIEKVALKVYMVPPAMLGGIVAGILLWVIYLLALRMLSSMRAPGKAKNIDLTRGAEDERRSERDYERTSYHREGERRRDEDLEASSAASPRSSLNGFENVGFENETTTSPSSSSSESNQGRSSSSRGSSVSSAQVDGSSLPSRSGSEDRLSANTTSGVSSASSRYRDYEDEKEIDSIRKCEKPEEDPIRVTTTVSL